MAYGSDLGGRQTNDLGSARPCLLISRFLMMINLSQYHKRCQHDCEDDCDLLQYSEVSLESSWKTLELKSNILVETQK